MYEISLNTRTKWMEHGCRVIGRWQAELMERVTLAT